MAKETQPVAHDDFGLPVGDPDAAIGGASPVRVDPATASMNLSGVEDAALTMRQREAEIGERMEAEGTGPLARIARLELLAARFFGAEHFQAPAPVFNPDAEREAARARFMVEMQEIESRTAAPRQ